MKVCYAKKNLENSINTMEHRNFVRDAVYGILHHCEQQRNGRYDQRHPMAETGQIPDEMATAIFNLGFQLLEAALTTNGINNTQGHQVDNQTDVLSAATTAYQRGHITKAQYFAVINALDEPTAQTTAYVQRTGSIIRG